MRVADETIFHCRRLEAFGPLGLLGPGRAIEHRFSLPAATIKLPPLRVGRMFMETWPARELPEPGAWCRPDYTSIAPPLLVLNRALVHSAAGIVAVEDHVIGETLAHTTPATSGYRNLVRAIALPPRPPRRLRGTWINLLSGSAQNYFHALVLGLARLAAVPESTLASASGVLVPEGAVCLREALELLDLPPSLEIIEVGQTETLFTETLIFPLSVVGEAVYHPCVGDFFRRLSGSVAPGARHLPRRIYIDRRGSGLRPLTNEAQLVAALQRLGFVAVRPEALALADQIRLFRQAEIIVAPHGAGLTNLGFARPGTVVIELLMDAYVNWCFRHLAALMRLQYDCLLGRTRQPWPELDGQLHAVPWEVPVDHVAAAVAQALPMPARAAA